MHFRPLLVKPRRAGQSKLFCRVAVKQPFLPGFLAPRRLHKSGVFYSLIRQHARLSGDVRSVARRPEWLTALRAELCVSCVGRAAPWALDHPARSRSSPDRAQDYSRTHQREHGDQKPDNEGHRSHGELSHSATNCQSGEVYHAPAVGALIKVVLLPKSY